MNFSSVPARDFISRPSFRDPVPALWAGLAYYFGAEIASMLGSAPVPISNLQPGGAILLAALLVTPARYWLSILFVALPVHLFVYGQHDLPLTIAFGWFVGNCSLALLGAVGVDWILHQPLRLGILRHAIVFVAWCAGLAPAIAALLEVAMLRAAGAPPGTFWPHWTAHVVSSAALVLVLVPVPANHPPVQRLAGLGQARWIEAVLLVFALGVTGAILFLGHGTRPALAPLVAYIPLPLLLWTAIRFGPFGAGCAFLLFSMFVIVGTAAGNGPFAGDARAGAALFLPLFLAGVAVPLLLLCAAIQERRGTLAALQKEQGKLGLALAAERKRAEHLVRERHARAEVEQRIAERTVALRRANDVLRAEIEGRKQAVEQLTHLTRVVMLGELSGALAHEINQPLAAILSNAQAARRLLAQPGAGIGEVRDILDDIVDEDKRAGEVIQRLRALLKKGELMLRPLDVSDLVRDALKLTQANLAGRGVEVHLDLHDGLVVRGDRVQLQQVLLNLIVNAGDALRGAAVDNRHLCLRTQALEGALVEVSVSDSGPGIPPGLIGKIFDPCFTTKTDGLGFGLSISRTIINQHGGQLEAANGPAGGSVFRISLPSCSGGNNV